MGSIDINKYIYTPASIFELQGRCWNSDSDGVPCRIKVGPRRFLNEQVHPEELKLVLWQRKNGVVTYLPNEPVPLTTEEDGTLLIDAVALSKKYFGQDITFCSKDSWKWNKNRSYSDTFLTTNYGVASSFSVWLDINVTHSTLLLTPGALNLCGHDVLSIYWETFCDELGAHSHAMRPLVNSLLSNPHTLSAKAFQAPLASLEFLQEYGFNRLKIRTTRGEYDLNIGLQESITVSLKNGTDIINDYSPSHKKTPLEWINVLLQLMHAPSDHAVRTMLESFHAQGLVCKAR